VPGRFLYVFIIPLFTRPVASWVTRITLLTSHVHAIQPFPQDATINNLAENPLSGKELIRNETCRNLSACRTKGTATGMRELFKPPPIIKGGHKEEFFSRYCYRRFQKPAGDAVLEITSQLSPQLIQVVGKYITGYLVHLS
jgi:hypothetical protein